MIPHAEMPQAEIPHVDVLIIGAGISGIGSACHLKTQLPNKRFLVLEAHACFGGTWLIHRYPGIRSDSDLFTFGYRFKPWEGPPIASGAAIMRYLGEVIDEHGLAPLIRYGRRVLSADWSRKDRRWRVRIAVAGSDMVEEVTAGFLWSCAGYYRHDAGYTPDWPGLSDFAGCLIHPQIWPRDADLAAKRVVVIGSGATAATHVPALSGKCASLTMLQRSPTYFYAGSNRNALADTLRALDVDPAWTHEIVRRQILADQKLQTDLALAFPKEARQMLIQEVRNRLGPDFDVETHFTPRYDPWRQRIAFVPDGDLFEAVKRGKVDLVTDRISHFVPDGIVLESGGTWPADVVISATGFHMAVLGDVTVSVDGIAVDVSQELTWRGLMMTGVPNLGWLFGYFRASWTLRVDLLGDFVCRLLRHMDARRATSVEAAPRPEKAGMARTPWLEGQEFSPGYMQRGGDIMPRRGEGPEWTHTQDYWAERDELPGIDFALAPLRFA